MNDSSKKISPLRQRMMEDMRLRKLPPQTQSGYIRAVRHFAGWLRRSPDTASAEDLRRYQLRCVDRGVSPVTLKHCTALSVAYGAGLRESPLSIEGAADRWNHRVDDDYYSRPRALFRLLTPPQRQALFENTARSIGEAPHEIPMRHIGNCLKCDPAYGKGIADALGIRLGDAAKSVA